MAHFAKIGLNSKVIAVNAVNDEDTTEVANITKKMVLPYLTINLKHLEKTLLQWV